MTVLGELNCDEPPHVNEIRSCEETVEINRLALARLLLMSERVPRANGSDSVAKGMAFDALDVDGLCRRAEDIEL